MDEAKKVQKNLLRRHGGSCKYRLVARDEKYNIILFVIMKALRLRELLCEPWGPAVWRRALFTEFGGPSIIVLLWIAGYPVEGMF
jgi:hypothetical protein